MDQNDNQIFDAIAIIEDVTRQAHGVLKAIPGEIRNALAAEYARSKLAADLPAVISKAEAAAERMEQAAAKADTSAESASDSGAFLGGAIRGLVVVACVACLAIPLVTWGFAYMQTSDIRKEHEKLRSEIREMEASAAAIRAGEGGGILLEQVDEKSWITILPHGAQVTQDGALRDGRRGVRYSVSE